MKKFKDPLRTEQYQKEERRKIRAAKLQNGPSSKSRLTSSQNDEATIISREILQSKGLSSSIGSTWQTVRLDSLHALHLTHCVLVFVHVRARACMQILGIEVPVTFDQPIFSEKFDKIKAFPGFKQWVNRMDTVRTPSSRPVCRSRFCL